MKAYLILEDGHVFEGKAFGAQREVISEFVFNTSMTGYVEVLTDPSYAGQSVVMTYPLIGNYGVSYKDQESAHPFVEGFVIHELSRVGSNFRMNMNLYDYMLENNIPGICNVDTRAVTKLIRNHGCMNGMITTRLPEDMDKALGKIRAFRVEGVVERVTCDEISTLNHGGSPRVALYDFGAKRNIAQSLVERGCEVTVLPASTPASYVIDEGFDGVMLSNGPGDPEENTAVIEEIKVLAQSGIPIFAICLGHQMMALAHGFKTEKLKFGHHGANHPVKDLHTGRVYISTQNHNYVLREDSIDPQVAKPWFVNVNDGTNEGVEYLQENIRTVQFHPEACAGPTDTDFLFDGFMQMMGGKDNA